MHNSKLNTRNGHNANKKLCSIPTGKTKAYQKETDNYAIEGRRHSSSTNGRPRTENL